MSDSYSFDCSQTAYGVFLGLFPPEGALGPALGRQCEPSVCPSPLGSFTDLEASVLSELGISEVVADSDFENQINTDRALSDLPEDTSTTVGIVVGGRLENELEEVGDKDWIRVSLVAGQEYQFDLIGGTEVGQLRDPYLYLYGNDGRLVTRNDDGGEGRNSRIEFTAPASGEYYLEAAAYRNRYAGTYVLTAQDLSPEPPPAPEPEPAPTDDFAGDSTTTGVVVVGSDVSGDLEVEGDEDWFSILLTEGEVYQFDLVGITLADPWLVLYGSGGAEELIINDNGGEGSNARIEYTAEASGEYFLAAAAYNDASSGTYRLSAVNVTPEPEPEPEPAPEPAPPPSGDLPEDTSTTVGIVVGGRLENELEEVGDKDWIRVSLVAGQEYQFDLIGGTEVGQLRDPYLYLYGNDGRLVTRNDDGGEGRNSRIEFTAPASGEYYLEAAAYGNRYAGTYVLTAQDLSPEPPPATQPGSLPAPSNFSSVDGYGRASAEHALEFLLGIDLPDQTDFGGLLWSLDAVGAPEVWAGGPGFDGVSGEGVIVAVLDTGVDLDHPEFAGRLVPGYDFVDGDNVPDDLHGHGTHVAGTIGAANDGVGITGVAYNSQIMPIRVLDENGSGWDSDIAAGIIWAVDNGAHVINLSLGGSRPSTRYLDALQYAHENDVLVVMASGNNGSSSPGYPAYYANQFGLAVGAVDSSGSVANFSNRAGSGPIDYVTAPGVGVTSTTMGGGYATWSGTSMATPQVAGIAALLLSYDMNLSASDLEQLIAGTASRSTGSNPVPASVTSSDLVQSQSMYALSTMYSLQGFPDPLTGLRAFA